MTFDQMYTAVQSARDAIRAADQVANRMAYIIKDRLRAGDINADTLRAFKRELRNFDMTTGKWKG